MTGLFVKIKIHVQEVELDAIRDYGVYWKHGNTGRQIQTLGNKQGQKQANKSGNLQLGYQRQHQNQQRKK